MMTRDEIKTATREQLAEELGAACEPTEDWETADVEDLRERVTALVNTYAVTIQNTNDAYGDPAKFTAQTTEDAVADMQAAIRECGPEFAAVVVTESDYEVVDRA